MVLGDPVAGEAQGLSMADEIDRSQQRFARPFPFDDGYEIEDGDRDHDGLCWLTPERARR